MIFFCKKILILLFSVWIAASATFFLMHSVPGDPFIGDRVIPEEVLKALHAHFGLDLPLGAQYVKYFRALLQGDLGPSIVYEGRSVGYFIKDGLPISMRLGIQALCIAIPFGIFLGVWSAMRRGKWQDHLAMAISTIGICVPSFVLSSLLQFFFAMKLSWLPVALWGNFSHTILPTLALAAMPTAFIARLMRSNLVEVLEQDYILTARSKGIPYFRVCIRHGLRNAILPVIAYLGPVFAQILTGSFLIEKIFAIPGLGQWMIHSINGRDYPMIMGLVIFYSSLLMLSIFIVDLLYAWLDPRVRYD